MPIYKPSTGRSDSYLSRRTGGMARPTSSNRGYRSRRSDGTFARSSSNRMGYSDGRGVRSYREMRDYYNRRDNQNGENYPPEQQGFRPMMQYPLPPYPIYEDGIMGYEGYRGYEDGNRGYRRRRGFEPHMTEHSYQNGPQFGLHAHAHEHEHYHHNIGEREMSDPINVLAISPGTGCSGAAAYPMPMPVPVMGGYGGCGNGWGGLGGDGIVGGLLLGGLLGGRGFGGFGGFGGGFGGGCGSNSMVQDTAILAAIGNVQGSIPLTALQTQAQIAESTGDINLATAQQTLAIGGEIARGALASQQGFANVKDSVQNSFAALSASVASVNAAVNVGTLTTAIAIRDDGDKTRALISSIDRDSLNRQLSDANNLIAELKYGREADSRHHGIEIQMINNQNQNQMQFQAQAQALNHLHHGLGEVNQLAKATNQNILVGNTGASTVGAQTASPTNVTA